MPVDELRSFASGNRSKADADRIAAAKAALEAGQEVPDDLVTDEDANRGFTMVAHLVIGWRVYDATSTEADQPLLPLPATPELVGKLPQDILTAIMAEVNGVNPQANPEGSTGRTS